MLFYLETNLLVLYLKVIKGVILFIKCKNFHFQINTDSVVCYVNNTVVLITSANLTAKAPPTLNEVCKVSLGNHIRLFQATAQARFPLGDLFRANKQNANVIGW